LLHHSRYAVEDRTWLDRQLLSIFGLNGNRGSIIAVTTQTAEQSLDIDADLLITDACPADVLLQRLAITPPSRRNKTDSSNDRSGQP
jgi:CRISPR-associated endonuclease/helicase Cas3